MDDHTTADSFPAISVDRHIEELLERAQLGRLLEHCKTKFLLAEHSSEIASNEHVIRTNQLQQYVNDIQERYKRLGLSEKLLVLQASRFGADMFRDEDELTMFESQISVLKRTIDEWRSRTPLKETMLEDAGPEEEAASSAATTILTRPAPSIRSRLRARSQQNSTALDNSPVSLQKKEHDDMADDLVRMAAILKRNNLQMQAMLREDTQLLSEASKTLEGNVGRLGKEGTRLKTFSRKSWGTTWLVWMVFLVVMVSFLVMYLFIRISRKQ